MSDQLAFPNLAGHRYMCLTTFRKNGKGVSTPVWFAEGKRRVYVYTAPDSGKVKRIRNNPRVEVAPCTFSGKPLGAAATAFARILPPEETSAARNGIVNKYGWQARIGMFLSRLRRREPPAYLEIVPA